jgi:hypothetical protein
VGVSPVVKYTLARLGLFGLVAAVLLVVPLPLDVFLRLLIALLISAVASYFLFKGMRDEVALHLAAAMERRQARKARLQAALAGEEDER